MCDFAGSVADDTRKDAVSKIDSTHDRSTNSNTAADDRLGVHPIVSTHGNLRAGELACTSTRE